MNKIYSAIPSIASVSVELARLNDEIVSHFFVNLAEDEDISIEYIDELIDAITHARNKLIKLKEDLNG